MRQQSLELQRQRFTMAGIATAFVTTALGWITRVEAAQLRGTAASVMLLAVLSAFLILSFSMSFGI